MISTVVVTSSSSLEKKSKKIKQKLNNLKTSYLLSILRGLPFFSKEDQKEEQEEEEEGREGRKGRREKIEREAKRQAEVIQ